MGRGPGTSWKTRGGVQRSYCPNLDFLPGRLTWGRPDLTGSLLGPGDVRAGSRGVSSGVSHTHSFQSSGFRSPPGNCKVQSRRKKQPQVPFYLRALCASLNRPWRPHLTLPPSVTCRCHTPLRPNPLTAAHYGLGYGPPTQSPRQLHRGLPQLHRELDESGIGMRGLHRHRVRPDPLGRPGRRAESACADAARPSSRQGAAGERGRAKLNWCVSEPPAALLLLPGSCLPTLIQVYRRAPYWSLGMNPSV